MKWPGRSEMLGELFLRPRNCNALLFLLCSEELSLVHVTCAVLSVMREFPCKSSVNGMILHQVCASSVKCQILKVVANADEAVADLKDGSTVLVGGFGLCGIPEVSRLHCANRAAAPKIQPGKATHLKTRGIDRSENLQFQVCCFFGCSLLSLR